MLRYFAATLFLFFMALQGEAQLGKFLKKLKSASGNSSSQTTSQSGPEQNLNLDEPIPPVIQFDWVVVQQGLNEKDNSYKQVTTYYTDSGEYVGANMEPGQFMMYSKKGNTWILDSNEKTITVFSMPTIMGEGGMMGKALAEKFNKGPLPQDPADADSITIVKSGNTKTILTYTADEYQASRKSAPGQYASIWYATVPFDPVKIYTMGVGRPADISKFQTDPKLINNPLSIPIVNKDYLLAEEDVQGQQVMQTLSITPTTYSINTTGYTIKVIHGLKDMFKKGN
ncbi:MAG TPA: hypothetical protein VG847_15645 [Chitinophagaceae bacterium]|nr:hypothetical protein [Chitinophagaceae bacterium]